MQSPDAVSRAHITPDRYANMALGHVAAQILLECRDHFLGLVGTRKGLAQL
jgi:hypothetical protein